MPYLIRHLTAVVSVTTDERDALVQRIREVLDAPNEYTPKERKYLRETLDKLLNASE